MSDERPSIAELIAAADDAIGGTISERLDARDRIVTATPVLLKVVAAAMAWRDQRALNLQAALLRTESEIEAEAQDIQRARVKRTAELARALEAALGKVRQ